MAAIESIALNKSALSLEVDATETLTVNKTPQDSEGTITWKSSDPAIATVNDGLVTAIKAGSTTITASASELITDTCEVTVTAKEEGTDPASEGPDLTFMDDGKIPVGILYMNTVDNVN